jgi:nucleoid-associated protein YgaU
MTQTEVQSDKAQAAGWSGALRGGVAALVLIVLAVIGWAVWGPKSAPKPDAKTAALPVTSVAPKPDAAAVSPANVTAPPTGGQQAAPNVAASAVAPEAQAVTGADAAPNEATDAGAQNAPQSAPNSNASTKTATVQFDALRATPDGAVTLAGRVDPGAEVDILVDGQSVAQARADGAGNFASLFDLPPSNGARALSLRVTGTDGVARDSAQSLVLRPAQTELAAAQASPDSATMPSATQAPVEMAQAAPAPIVTDSDGARLLAPASDTLVIDTISFGQGRRAAAEGRGAPADSKLSAYLDGALVAQTEPGRAGRWSLDLPGLSPGAHRLRIDAIGTAGKVVARAETTFDQPDQIVVAQAGDLPQASSKAQKSAGGDGDAVKVVQIVQGNTLWAIAREVYGDGILYVRVFDANRDQIRNPDLIYPGQVFTIPSPQ